mmetsp:Transcript_2201/g.5603  ORF Transcript_2201/g.5603 Transcript_2201/m.5603 type:complete len:504 (+) Transcript_2201:87-1598(+)
MEEIPKAGAEDDAKLPDVLCTFFNWLLASGRKESTAKSYMTFIRTLYDEDGRSVEGLLSEEYYAIILRSPQNKKGNNQRSASLKCFKAFWDDRGSEGRWDASNGDKRFAIKRSKADSPEAPLNGHSEGDTEAIVRRPAPKSQPAAKKTAVRDDGDSSKEQVKVGGLPPSHHLHNRLHGIYTKTLEVGDEGRAIYHLASASSNGKDTYLCFQSEKGVWRLTQAPKDAKSFAKCKDKSAELPWKLQKPWKVYDGKEFEEVRSFKVTEVVRRKNLSPTLPDSMIQELMDELGEPPATRASIKVGHDKQKSVAQCTLQGDRLKVSYSRCWNSATLAERVLLLCAARMEQSGLQAEVDAYSLELQMQIESKADEGTAPASSVPLLQVEVRKAASSKQPKPKSEKRAATTVESAVDSAKEEDSDDSHGKRKHEEEEPQERQSGAMEVDWEGKRRRVEDEEEKKGASDEAAAAEAAPKAPLKLGRAAAKMSVRSGVRCGCHYLLSCPALL